MIGLQKIAIAIGGVAILCFGAYLKGRSDGAEKIQDRWDVEKIVQAEAFQQAVANKELVEEQRDVALKEIADELEPKLAAAESSVAGLARRLRLATSRPRDCPVPGDPAPADGDRGAGGVSDGTLEAERLADETWAAAARDSTRLTACQLAYERVRRAGRD